MLLGWCTPAFLHGWTFGSYDTALSAGLGSSLVSSVHDLVNGDQARQGAAWASLNWQAVHSGHLPLWNPFSDLGLPELANFQSAPASLPSLVSYLFPLRDAYTVEVLVRMFVGGVGCYFAARVLGARRSAALLAGVVGEIGGPMAAWAGWPQTGVAEWTGWFVGFVVLALRVKSQPCLSSWKIGAGIAVTVAFVCTGGFPEVVALLAIAAAVIVLVTLAFQRRSKLRSLLIVSAGTAAGLMLSAPIWLPGIVALKASTTSLRGSQSFLDLHDLALLLDPGWFGTPSTSGSWFGPLGPGEYFESAAFVGPVVLGLALFAIARRRRSGDVIALAIATLVVGGLAFGLEPLRAIVLDVPELRTVAFARGLLVACDLLGVLAAVGLEEMLRHRPGRTSLVVYGLSVGATMVLLVVGLTGGGLDALDRRERLDGVWLAVAGLVVLGLFLVLRSSKLAGRVTRLRPGLLVVVAEAVTLILASSTISTWSSTFLPHNAAIDALASSTTSGLVALGGDHAPYQPPRLGIYPELNAAYAVRELAGYDAATPRALEQLWATLAPAPDLAAYELDGDVTQFAPAIESLREARAFGVSYLLEPAHGALRLVSNPSRCVAGALAARAPAGSSTSTAQAAAVSSATTGIVDDLEWWAEQPTLLRAYPYRRKGALVRYLTAAAANTPGTPVAEAPMPSPAGEPAAATIAPLLVHSPSLAAGLDRCLTDKAPTGLVRVGPIGSEVLYKVPGVAGAYFGDASTSTSTSTVLTSLVYTGDASATVTVRTARSAWLTLTIDAEKGWSASTGSGDALTTSTSGALVRVFVPAGVHTIVLHYWPGGMTIGLIFAILGVVGLAVVPSRRVVRRVRSGRRSSV